MLRLSRQVMALLELRRLSARMANTLETMESMRGLLLVCFVCQRVRDDQGHWLPPEAFLRRNLDASVSTDIARIASGKRIGMLNERLEPFGTIKNREYL